MTRSAPDLVVFDGVCVLCNGFARLVHRRDAGGRIRFATAQSEIGRALYVQAGLAPDAIETILVRQGETVLLKSDAVFAVLRQLGGFWRILALARAFPRPIRDWAYDRVARNRYALFGRHDRCPLPSAAFRARFVEQGLTDDPGPQSDQIG